MIVRPSLYRHNRLKRDKASNCQLRYGRRTAHGVEQPYVLHPTAWGTDYLRSHKSIAEPELELIASYDLSVLYANILRYESPNLSLHC